MTDAQCLEQQAQQIRAVSRGGAAKSVVTPASSLGFSCHAWLWKHLLLNLIGKDVPVPPLNACAEQHSAYLLPGECSRTFMTWWVLPRCHSQWLHSIDRHIVCYLGQSLTQCSHSALVLKESDSMCVICRRPRGLKGKQASALAVQQQVEFVLTSINTFIQNRTEPIADSLGS